MESELLLAALERPRVRINQLGYPIRWPKRATWIHDVDRPQLFEVVNQSGAAVFTGNSSYQGYDAASGFSVHQLDFSGFDEPGVFRVLAGSDSSHWFSVGNPSYQQLFNDSLIFFYLQRSGIAIDERFVPGYGRPAGHLNASPNEGDLAVPAWSGSDAQRLYPEWECDGTFDVSGGWYDAGDHGKYVVSGGISAAILLSAHERLIRRHGRIPEHLVTFPSLLEEAMWEVNWMVKMQVPERVKYAGMAFHRVHDTYWTAFPMAPHLDPAPRVLHRPSTAATLNLAAVAAQASRLVRKDHAERAAELLNVAERAYRAALLNPGVFAPDDKGAFGGGPYNDDEVDDEFYWAAVELFLTTGKDDYRHEVFRSPCHRREVFDLDGFECEKVAAVARLQLASASVAMSDDSYVRQSVFSAADRIIELQSHQPWGQHYGPAEWDWGSNGRILNNLIVIATAYDLSSKERYLESLLSGMDYLFGRNPVGLSSVTGFGVDFAHRQRVRHFANSLDPSFPPPRKGSLAGGPASKIYLGFPHDARFRSLPAQLCYVDEPTSETTNDNCVRWNASLVWMAAFLADTFEVSNRND